jgi:hypothetical protein
VIDDWQAVSGGLTAVCFFYCLSSQTATWLTGSTSRSKIAGLRLFTLRFFVIFYVTMVLLEYLRHLIFAATLQGCRSHYLQAYFIDVFTD